MLCTSVKPKYAYQKYYKYRRSTTVQTSVTQLSQIFRVSTRCMHTANVHLRRPIANTPQYDLIQIVIKAQSIYQPPNRTTSIKPSSYRLFTHHQPTNIVTFENKNVLNLEHADDGDDDHSEHDGDAQREQDSCVVDHVALGGHHFQIDRRGQDQRRQGACGEWVSG